MIIQNKKEVLEMLQVEALEKRFEMGWKRKPAIGC
jgi:hypothetical protein